MTKVKSVKLLWALLAIFFIGIGIAFNAATLFGNDPIGILYDGVRNFARLSDVQLGYAVYIVNMLVALLVFIFGRRYINIGTLIYILPYGLFVNLGTRIYNQILRTDVFIYRCIIVTFGCLFIFFGVAVFIAVDIGLDPFTGFTMVIRDKLGWSFRNTKMVFDGVVTLIGFLLGGTLGVITIITVLIGGPMIQWILSMLQKIIKVDKN